MKLLAEPPVLNYALMWKCHGLRCGKWVDKDLDECPKCGQTRPRMVEESASVKQFVRMLDTCITFAVDHGLQGGSAVLRSLIIAYGTQTEGYLETLCRTFAMLHKFYRQDGDKFMLPSGQWKERKLS